MFQTDDVEKIKTLITYSNIFVKNHAVNGIMWKNSVGPDRWKCTSNTAQAPCMLNT